MSTVAQILSAVVQIAANYGGTLTQPTNSFNSAVTTGDAIVVFVSWLSADGYVVSVTDNQSNLYLAVDPIQVGVTSSQTWVCYGARGGPCSVMATLSGFQNGSAIAATYDGSSSAAGVNIYLDGVLQPVTTESDNLTGSIIAAGQQMLIGNQNGRSSTFFARGYIDEFSIHNVVRSASYLAAISPANLPQVDSNVQLMYHFDEGAGVIAHDASGNHLNATFSIPQ